MIAVVTLVLALVVAALAGVGVLAHRLVVVGRALATAGRTAAEGLGMAAAELTDELAVTSLESEHLRAAIARRSTGDVGARDQPAGA